MTEFKKEIINKTEQQEKENNNDNKEKPEKPSNYLMMNTENIGKKIKNIWDGIGNFVKNILSLNESNNLWFDNTDLIKDINWTKEIVEGTYNRCYKEINKKFWKKGEHISNFLKTCPKKERLSWVLS